MGSPPQLGEHPRQTLPHGLRKSQPRVHPDPRLAASRVPTIHFWCFSPSVRGAHYGSPSSDTQGLNHTCNPRPEASGLSPRVETKGASGHLSPGALEKRLGAGPAGLTSQGCWAARSPSLPDGNCRLFWKELR